MASKTQRFDTRQHMRSSTYEVFRYKDAYLKEVALHHHDFYEIYFFLSGNVQYNIESRSYLLTPGDVLLINPMELHQPVFGKEGQNARLAARLTGYKIDIKPASQAVPPEPEEEESEEEA